MSYNIFQIKISDEIYEHVNLQIGYGASGEEVFELPKEHIDYLNWVACNTNISAISNEIFLFMALQPKLRVINHCMFTRDPLG